MTLNRSRTSQKYYNMTTWLAICLLDCSSYLPTYLHLPRLVGWWRDTLSVAEFVLFHTELPWAYEGRRVAWKQRPQHSSPQNRENYLEFPGRPKLKESPGFLEKVLEKLTLTCKLTWHILSKVFLVSVAWRTKDVFTCPVLQRFQNIILPAWYSRNYPSPVSFDIIDWTSKPTPAINLKPRYTLKTKLSNEELRKTYTGEF